MQTATGGVEQLEAEGALERQPKQRHNDRKLAGIGLNGASLRNSWKKAELPLPQQAAQPATTPKFQNVDTPKPPQKNPRQHSWGKWNALKHSQDNPAGENGTRSSTHIDALVSRNAHGPVRYVQGCQLGLIHQGASCSDGKARP